MKKGFTLSIIILALAMVLAACGAKDNKENNSGATNSPETEQTGAATTEPTTEPSAPADAGTVVVKHQLGEDTVTKNPQKVVVFDYGTLDTLDKLGVEVAAMPKGSLPEYLNKFADDKYVNAGNLKEPDMETIHGMSPDLIIISGRQSDYYEEFKKIAPTIFMGVDNNNYMESFKSNVTILADIFDKQTEAEAALAEIDTKIAGIQAKTKDSDKKGLIILSNEGNISAYGPKSRFGIIHDVFGVKPADETIKANAQHGDSVTFEFIAEKNPDYLFVIDRNAVVAGSGSAKETLNNDLVKNTTAFKEDQVLYLNPQFWYLSGGGLISVAEMVNEIEAGLK
ncbi:siderophore ABC transporter substrate-binding protein [Paenibacillus yanchengensis]|uniref:Siderophore ABC transporter substrate-binding protein n=1 Tax=Paenibacillus yanchengensis TaxID=2035833 RepID=A0ABW4YJK0_9BACL